MGKNILTKELLLKSVEEWNEARRANPDLTPDLSGKDLSDVAIEDAHFNNADLSSIDARNANLRHSVLIRTSFTRADLAWSDFTFSDLNGADFSEANLIDTNFTVANLSDAILNGADLRGVNFSGTELSNANFTGAKIGGTTFGAVDLSSAIGFDSIRHYGPSTIGIDTIYASNGNIPEVFLRGCGVPDSFITYAHSLTSTAIDYYSCFISYSSKDDDIAKRIHNDLQASGVRCWFAPHDLPIGAKTRPAIDDAIRIHDKLLLILSEHSVQSNWVEHEVEHALDLETERGKLVLFPVRLDDAVMDSKKGWASNVKRQRNIGDFTKWKDHDAYQKAFSRLLKDLKQSDKPQK